MSMILVRNPSRFAGVAPGGSGGGGPFPTPSVNEFYNSTEFEMSGGVPVDSNILFMDDFARGWASKANFEGWLLGTGGTRIFTGAPTDSGNLQYTAGWGYNIFADTSIPDPAGIPGIGAGGTDPLQTQTGRGGAVYASSHGTNDGSVGGDWFGDHDWAAGSEHVFIRFDVYFYSGYQFGAEKIGSVNPPNWSGTGGIIWGNLHINLGAGSASSTGTVYWQGVNDAGGSTSHSTTFVMSSGRWYSIQAELDRRASAGSQILRVYCDDLGTDGNTIPSGGTPTLRLERTNYTFVPASGTHTQFGNLWAESWANWPSTGVQKRTNYVVRDGAGGLIPIRNQP